MRETIRKDSKEAEPGGSFLISKKEAGKLDIQSIILALAACIPSGITGFCFWLMQRKLTKRQKEEEKKEDARRKNETIVIEGVIAAITLGEATAKAVQRIPDAHCNGDMHDALDYATAVKNKHRDFIREQGIDALY